MRVPDVAVVRVGLKMGGRRKEEYIKSRKSVMLLFWSYLSRSALKSPSKTTVLFSEEKVSRRFARYSLLNSENSMDRCLYM